MSGGRATVAGIAATSAALLMTELSLTRIFSVTMFHHFAFLAISIALFGLSASGVFVYVGRRRLAARPAEELLAWSALVHSAATLASLALLVNLRADYRDSPYNILPMVAVYLAAALPFFSGGAVLSLAFSRLTERINVLYAADLIGAAAGCLALVPLLNLLGAPGVILGAAALAAVAATCFAPEARRRATWAAAGALIVVPALLQSTALAPFEISSTKGHERDVVLFSKWNSFSRVGVYDRAHADWSLSPRYKGTVPPSLMMDIDSSASTPILKGSGNLSDAAYLRYELTTIGYHLVERPQGFTALVIGPGGGRDLLSALVFGARQVDGVEINPIIVRDVMLGGFRDYSGGIYADPRVSIHIEDGRSFVRRTPKRFDLIQASLVDTWAATAAGAYSLTENSLYTVEAFVDYLDHLAPEGMLSVTRWMSDGLRLVSLAQEACARRGLDPQRHIAAVRAYNMVTFLLKRSPFSAEEAARLQRAADDLGFQVLYAPGMPEAPSKNPAHSHYRQLILAENPAQFVDAHPEDISATTDDRPFFFHTTKLRDQLRQAFGASALFGNGLSVLLTLFGISGVLVLAFVIGPLIAGGERPGPGWAGWLVYFGALGAGFMLLEVSLLQRFVLLLGHPVYSLTVTLFSLLLGTGAGSWISRSIPVEQVRRMTAFALVVAALLAVCAAFALAPLLAYAIGWTLPARALLAVALLVPFGVLLGLGLPGGMRLLHRDRPEIVAWGWALNGALSVVGATLAVFVAMNWGFSATLLVGALVYALAVGTLLTRSPA